MNRDDLFDSIAAEFLAEPEVTSARMFGGTALKVKNKVFACSYKGRLVLKLPASKVDALIASGHAERFDSGTGRPAKEWVAVDPMQGAMWLNLATEARDFVAG